MQGLAFLVTFGATAKSDWPCAAMERAGGKHVMSFSRPNDQAQGERWGCKHPTSFDRPLTLTLSREGRGDLHQQRRPRHLHRHRHPHHREQRRRNIAQRSSFPYRHGVHANVHKRYFVRRVLRVRLMRYRVEHLFAVAVVGGDEYLRACRIRRDDYSGSRGV